MPKIEFKIITYCAQVKNSNQVFYNMLHKMYPLLLFFMDANFQIEPN